jgi:hypothetical protein
MIFSRNIKGILLFYHRVIVDSVTGSTEALQYRRTVKKAFGESMALKMIH